MGAAGYLVKPIDPAKLGATLSPYRAGGRQPQILLIDDDRLVFLADVFACSIETIQKPSFVK